MDRMSHDDTTPPPKIFKTAESAREEIMNREAVDLQFSLHGVCNLSEMAGRPLKYTLQRPIPLRRPTSAASTLLSTSSVVTQGRPDSAMGSQTSEHVCELGAAAQLWAIRKAVRDSRSE